MMQDVRDSSANTVAPIVMFVFRRPDHTRQVLEALSADDIACESDLIVYSDGARTDAQRAAVAECRTIVRELTGFRSVQLRCRDGNLGLAANIEAGVGEVVETYGRAIVLEDDTVPHSGFLRFMNDALDKYEGRKDVWHISGWNYPISVDGLSDTFLWRVMNCWGWATWADRWQHFRRDPAAVIAEFDDDMRHRFNLDGAYDFFEQVEANADGSVRTWAIFWYATIFAHNGLCLNPARSMVTNIGLDGSGENCRPVKQALQMPAAVRIPHLTDDRCENSYAVRRIAEHLTPGLLARLMRTPGKIWRSATQRAPA